MKEFKKIKKCAIRAAKQAGDYALKHVGKIRQIEHKSGENNLVTDVDKSCERAIVEAIKKEFPNHSILAEEGSGRETESPIKWIIDPLDGTTNYAHGFPFFCVSIAVAFGDKVMIGIVYDPSKKEFFSAEQGKGAFLNKKRIFVSKLRSVKESLIATGFAYDEQGKIANIGHFEKMLKNAQAIRRAGSAAIDLCYVAAGRFDGFWELGLSPWDTAAGQLILIEAGGTITMLDGEPFDVFKKELVASNGVIHKEMLFLLKG
ncbi:MAG: inositol monophosphatase family protein [Candidatus Omnitrophota bacterium]